MSGEIVIETDIPIWALAQVKAVDPNVAVGHHSVERDIDTTMRVLHRKRERLAIPGDPGRKEGSGGAARIALIDGAGDAPVMRKGDRFPSRIVQSGPFGASCFPLNKLPLRIEIDDRGTGT